MFNLTDSLNLLDELINACDLKTQEAIEMQEQYECNGFSWAKYETTINEYLNFVTPNLILVKDSLLTLQSRYLGKCQEQGVLPSDDAPLNFEDLVDFPRDCTDEICTCPTCTSQDDEIDFNQDEEDEE